MVSSYPDTNRFYRSARQAGSGFAIAAFLFAAGELGVCSARAEVGMPSNTLERAFAPILARRLLERLAILDGRLPGPRPSWAKSMDPFDGFQSMGYRRLSNGALDPLYGGILPSTLVYRLYRIAYSGKISEFEYESLRSAIHYIPAKIYDKARLLPGLKMEVFQ